MFLSKNYYHQFKTARSILHLTQKDVSKNLGLSLASYCAIEIGKSDPKISTILKISDFFESKGILFQEDGNVTI